MSPPATETLAADLLARAERLHNRLSAPRSLEQPHRNPFAFYTPAPPPVPVRHRPEPEPLPTAGPLPAPVLELIGVAEQQNGEAIVRTAMISDGSDDLIMAVVGATIRGRYRVDAIGADAVELFDLSSETVRRLALR